MTPAGQAGLTLLVMAMALVAPHCTWTEARDWALVAGSLAVLFLCVEFMS